MHLKPINKGKLSHQHMARMNWWKGCLSKYSCLNARGISSPRRRLIREKGQEKDIRGIVLCLSFHQYPFSKCIVPWRLFWKCHLWLSNSCVLVQRCGQPSNTLSCLCSYFFSGSFSFFLHISFPRCFVLQYNRSI